MIKIPKKYPLHKKILGVVYGLIIALAFMQTLVILCRHENPIKDLFLFWIYPICIGQTIVAGKSIMGAK
ncbi:MAG: hypothetical protein LBC87_07345 [Fibromonadaceae bacterium]|nr:hypothetical protein [Fibromonadaceae bacterium]